MASPLIEALADCGLTVAEAEELLDEAIWSQELGEDVATLAWRRANELLLAERDSPIGLGWVAIRNHLVAVRWSESAGPASPPAPSDPGIAPEDGPPRPPSSGEPDDHIH